MQKSIERLQWNFERMAQHRVAALRPGLVSGTAAEFEFCLAAVAVALR